MLRSHFEPDSELDVDGRHERHHDQPPVAGDRFATRSDSSEIDTTTSDNEDSEDSDSAEFSSRDRSQSRSGTDGEKKSKARRFLPRFLYSHGRTVYGGNPIVQQTLPGYFLHPSPFVMIPLFFILMIPFVILGALIVVEGGRRYEVDVPYSHIHQYQYIPTDPAVNVNQGLRTFTLANTGESFSQGTVTWVPFEVKKKLTSPVFFYYKLDNYFQNFREFHDGRNINQLVGKHKIGSTDLCNPFGAVGYLDPDEGAHIAITYTNATTGVSHTKKAKDFTYNPCGTAAWSLFNDTLHLYKVLNTSESSQAEVVGGDTNDVPLRTICKGSAFNIHGDPAPDTPATQSCRKEGISWKADTNIRFHNMTIREDWWSLYYPHKTDNDYLANGWYLHEPGHALPDPMDLDLQVWMRASVRTTFRKLYRVIETDVEPGSYMMRVEEFYDVVSFRGQKSFVLRDDHWVGQKNTALGVIFIVIGCLCFVLGVAFGVELCLRRSGLDRLSTLSEPKKSWYYFDPQRPEFEDYYNLRTERYIPVAELQALRKAQGADSSDL